MRVWQRQSVAKCFQQSFSESDAKAHHPRDVLPVLGMLLLKTAVDPLLEWLQVEPVVVGVQRKVLHPTHDVAGGVGKLRV